MYASLIEYENGKLMRSSWHTTEDEAIAHVKEYIGCVGYSNIETGVITLREDIGGAEDA